MTRAWADRAVARGRPTYPEADSRRGWRAAEVFDVRTFEAGQDVWWVELLRRADGRPAMAFYHPDKRQARRKAAGLSEELRVLTAEEFRHRYGIV